MQAAGSERTDWTLLEWYGMGVNGVCRPESFAMRGQSAFQDILHGQGWFWPWHFKSMCRYRAAFAAGCMARMAYLLEWVRLSMARVGLRQAGQA